MQNFIFHNPTKIIFGNNTSTQLGEFAKPLGSKALLVYGQNSIKKSGLYNKIVTQLNEQNIPFIEHGGVKSNPSLAHGQEGVKKALDNQVDFIIAVGGGSVIDESKAIACSAGSNQDIWDIFTLKSPITKALPIITLLTLPATGSEMNAGMVITNDETKEKLGFGSPALYPVISILDPVLTYSVSPKYTAASAVDIISHLTESYFTNNGGWTPIQEYYVEGLVKTVIESTNKIMQNPEDSEARSVLMWAATLGWNGLNTAGIGTFSMPCHTLEHPISAIYNIPHGSGLAILTPAWLTARLSDKSAKIARFAREVFGINEKDDLSTAQTGIKTLKDWYIKIGAPVTFTQAGINNPDIVKLTELTLAGAAIRKVPELSKEFVEQIFKSCI